jgi:endonuclease/exonuclease/phosphatase family metal-dependent hydrolase
MTLQRTRQVTRIVISLLVTQLAGIQVRPASTSSLQPAGLSAFQREHTQAPSLLSYADLVRLYENDNPSPELQARLTRLLNTPFVNNDAAARGTRPLKPTSQRVGRTIRVAAWNIERGLEFEAVRAAFLNDQRFFRRVQSSGGSPKGSQLATVLSQAGELRQADIVVLNEVDWGLKRTGYRNIAKDLAAAMGMNYAYAVEFVEVDPLTLGTETLEGEVAPDKADLVRNIAVDKSRTLGLHGTAILSRFPLRNVRIFRFANQGHDWYADEKKGVSELEKGKRKGAGFVFEEKIAREVRRGGRMMLLADIEDAEIPGGKLTVVATHLESKTKPVNRVKQLEEVMAHIKAIQHPVILAGDMNTSGSDSTPTSFQREIKKRMGSSSFWVTQGVKYATGVGLLYDLTLGVVKKSRTRNDPTVKSVRFVSENPEEKFFNTLKAYRFSDGNAFDFRGTKAFSVGASQATLSNSNERASKGFASTFELLGKINVPLKLDWIFVKPANLTDPDDRKQSYLFAPCFGRTLKSLNYSLKDRISDHNPIIADLPLVERMSRE